MKLTKSKHKQHRESHLTVKNTHKLHFISSGRQSHHTKSKTVFLQATHNNGIKHSFTSPSFRTQDSGRYSSSVCSFYETLAHSLLPSQLCTKSPLQFTNYLLIRDGFSGFILLYNLGLLIDHLSKLSLGKFLIHSSLHDGFL